MKIKMSVARQASKGKEDAKFIKEYGVEEYDISTGVGQLKMSQMLQKHNHSLYEWEGGLRSKDNCKALHGLMIDYDSKEKKGSSFETAKKAFSKYKNIIYTSTSHTDESPSYHILLLFDKPIIKNFNEVMKAAKDQFKSSDDICFEAGRHFYPHFERNSLSAFKISFNLNGECWVAKDPVPGLKLMVTDTPYEDVDPDTSVELSSGDVITFRDVDENIEGPCLCPFHDDTTPSAHIHFDDKAGKPYLHCSTCRKTFWADDTYFPEVGEAVADVKKKAKLDPENIRKVLAYIGYEFKLNTMADDIDVSIHKGPYNRLSNPVRNDIYGKMALHGYDKKYVDYVMKGTYNSYNPLQDEFNSIPKWDGKDHIKTFIDHIKTEHNNLEMLFRRWIIGSVARIFEDNGTQNFCLVLDGPQGCGKSFIASWLAGKPKWFYDEIIDAARTDHKFAKARKLVWELSELGATFKKRDQDHLKNFISSVVIDDRKAYDHDNFIGVSRCSFIASVNGTDAGFLNDITGNRRYNVVRILSIDQSYSKLKDLRNSVYAQALSIYMEWVNNGRDIHNQPWDLTTAESASNDTIRENFSAYDEIEELVKENITITGLKTDIIKTTELHKQIASQIGGNIRPIATRVMAIMGKLGHGAVKKSNGRYYTGVVLGSAGLMKLQERVHADDLLKELEIKAGDL